MKSMSARRSGKTGKSIVRGVLTAVAATVILVAVFALLISLFQFSDGVIRLINQIIKLLSVFAGVWTAVAPGGERGLLRGAAVGFVYMALGVTVYALLTGQHLAFGAYLADILMGVAAGGLLGLLRARV